jgi:hyperosmotically inducible periplasmic protein
MKSKALAVLIPALFLSTAALAQSTTQPRDPATREPSEQAAPNDAKGAPSMSKQDVSDATITGKVKSALAADVGLRTVTGINVDTDAGGVVTLKGQVASADVKKRAEQVAKKVSGVKSVKNQLTVTKG